MTKIGIGTLTLSYPNTFSGPLAVNAGGVLLNSANAAQNSTVTIGNGSLTFQSGIGAFSFGGLAGNGNLSLNDTRPARLR